MAHTVSPTLTDETLNRIMAIESAGKLRAKAKTSTAAGPFQFLNGTWMDTVKKHRPDLLHGRTAQDVLALRYDGTISIELGARFTEDNARGLGDGYTDGDLYLAHFLGLGSARKVLRSVPTTSAVSVCGQAAANANKSIFYKGGSPVSCAQLRRWAQARMEHAWDALGEPDFVTQHYVAPPVTEHEVIEDAPVKQEAGFTQDEVEDIAADDEPDTVPVPRARPRAANPDDLGFTDNVKSVVKSKIVWLGTLLGVGGSGSAVTSDAATQNLLMQLVSRPQFWFAILALGGVGLLAYFYWRDHGKGSVS